MEVRLVKDEPASGSWNMAVDEALLATAAGGGPATLRFYGWEGATVSIGYFQGAAERGGHAASAGLPWVRRATGGGAIVHDRELTYSVAIPAERGRMGASAELYDLFHETLLETLGGWGIEARRCAPAEESSAQPWLCFQRRSSGDVLLGDWKIGGSAQRRQGAGVLQHGSVLLAASPGAPELLGLAELTGVGIEREELAERWLGRLERRWGVQFQSSGLSGVETAVAVGIQSERFGNSAWNEKR